MQCPICRNEASRLRDVDAVAYFRCLKCESVFAHPDFLAAVDAGAVGNYRDSYWEQELPAARERSFGPGVARMAETLRMARMPVRRALDIGSGPGLLLDALAELVPSLAERVHGVELFPPPPRAAQPSPNYHVGSVGDLEGTVRRRRVHRSDRASHARHARRPAAATRGEIEPGRALFLQLRPAVVCRGGRPRLSGPALAAAMWSSWSIAGARVVFEPAGFNVIALPGRDWAFLAEFGPPRAVGADTLIDWLWRPAPDNIALIRNDRFGPLFETIGLECARCYLEFGVAEERTRWAEGLRSELRRRRRRWLTPFAGG